MPSGYATGLDASNPSGADTVLRIEKPIGAGGAALATYHLPLPYSPGLRRHRVRPVRVQKAHDRPQTPSGPREETLIIGFYIDDLFTIYSHDDEHSIYHSFSPSA